MKTPKKDPVREDRIHNEAIADANGPEEQVMGWYHYCPAKLSGSRPNSLKIRPITYGRSRNDLNWKGAGLSSFRWSTG
jgi:hypothetical protein